MKKGKYQQKAGRNRETVGFVALGCPKNIVDSERMLAEIAKAGFLITTEPGPSNVWRADVVVVNTCGFIAPAKAEALKAIKHAVDCKHEGSVKKVIVAGCLSHRCHSWPWPAGRNSPDNQKNHPLQTTSLFPWSIAARNQRR
jgi:tRNA A37 methylthiotransferase MiaB